jgi:hypothetical protein
MGLGVVDPLGGSPAKKWAPVIALLSCERLQAAARDLFTGKGVLSTDGGVQLSWEARDGVRGRFRIRDADKGCEFYLEVDVRGLTQSEINALQKSDPAGLVTSTADWSVQRSKTSEAWALYNCRIERAQIRDGAPA